MRTFIALILSLALFASLTSSAFASHSYSTLLIPTGGVQAYQHVWEEGDIFILARYALVEPASTHTYGANGAITVVKRQNTLIGRGNPPATGYAIFAFYQPADVTGITWADNLLRVCLETNPTIAAQSAQSCKAVAFNSTDDSEATGDVLDAGVLAMVKAVERDDASVAAGTYATTDGLTGDGITLIRQAWETLPQKVVGILPVSAGANIFFDPEYQGTPVASPRFTAEMADEQVANDLNEVGGVFGIPPAGVALAFIVLIQGGLAYLTYRIGGDGLDSFVWFGLTLLFVAYLGLVPLNIAIGIIALVAFAGGLKFFNDHIRS